MCLGYVVISNYVGIRTISVCGFACTRIASGVLPVVPKKGNEIRNMGVTRQIYISLRC